MTNQTNTQALLDKFERLLEKNKLDMYAMAHSEFRVLYRELRTAIETISTPKTLVCCDSTDDPPMLPRELDCYIAEHYWAGNGQK